MSALILAGDGGAQTVSIRIPPIGLSLTYHWISVPSLPMSQI